jgi:hypothetical protein
MCSRERGYIRKIYDTHGCGLNVDRRRKGREEGGVFAIGGGFEYHDLAIDNHTREKWKERMAKPARKKESE